MLAVHGGVGTVRHGIDRLCADAVKKWRNDPVQAVVHMETDPLVNCGYGSSLTSTGRVEVEAGYMCSESFAFGAVGSVTNTRHPVLAAKCLADKYIAEKNFFLIPPQVVVGEGAEALIREMGLPICTADELKSPSAFKDFERAKGKLESMEDTPMEEKMDTVGSVYVHESGRSEACVSSGGMVLKKDGRLGHSTFFGSGVWAEQRETKSIAISTSGCGEALTRVRFAQSLAEFVFDMPDEEMLPSAVNYFCRSSCLMADKPFKLPVSDDDLTKESDEFFWVQNVSSDEETFERAIEAFSQMESLEYLPNFFSELYSMFKNYEIGEKSLRIDALKILCRHKDSLEAQILECVPIEEANRERIPAVKNLILMYLYLFCRFLYVLEADYLKCSEKKKQNDDAPFMGSYNSIREAAHCALRDIICLAIDIKNITLSAIKELFSNEIPRRLPVIVSNTVFKILSNPENQQKNEHIRRIQLQLFQILVFMGKEWKVLRGIVKEFVAKLFGWEYYYKSCSTFVYMAALKEIPDSVYFLDAMLAQFMEEKFDTAEKVKPFNLFISTLATACPEIVANNFSVLYRLIKNEQGGMRSLILSIMEVVLKDRFLRDEFGPEDEVYLLRIQHCLYDQNANVRNRAMNVFSNLISSCFERKSFPRSFYAKGILNDLAQCLESPLSSVRKHAAQALDVIIRKNPFGADLDIEKLHKDYISVQKELDSLKAVVDDDEFEEELQEKKDMEEENAAKELVSGILKEYLEKKNFPEKSEIEMTSEEVMMTEMKISTMFKNPEEKKEAIVELANYFFAYKIPNIDEIDFENMVEDMVRILLKYHVGMIDRDEEERKKYAAEQKKREKIVRIEEETEKLNRILESMHYALHIEECMNTAVGALSRSDRDVEPIIRFIAGCRSFHIRKSESAIKQICKLIYSKNDDVRKYIINTGKEIFFSLNSKDDISERSTVQKILQVVHGSTMEERCIVTDTLVAIFKKDGIKKGAVNFLWQLAFNENEETALLALRVLYACALADPKAMQKDFGNIVKVMKDNKQDKIQVEALRLAVAVGMRIPDEELQAKEKVEKPFRFPPTDDFFVRITREVVKQLPYIEAKRWCTRARLTMKAIFELSTSPDELTNNLISPILLKVRYLNSQLRIFRRLWLLSTTTMNAMRKKLREKNMDVAFTLSSETGIDSLVIELSEKMENTTVVDELTQLTLTQGNLTENMDITTATFNDDIPVFDVRKPQFYDKYQRFTKRKKKTQMRKRLEGLKPKEAMECLKMTFDEEGNPDFESLKEILKIGKQIPLRDFKKVQMQCISLFVLMKNTRRTWQLVLKRLFFMVKEYISRTIFFVTDSMTHGLEKLRNTLETVTNADRGVVKALGLLSNVHSDLSVFEKDNLCGASIYASSKGIEGAVGQSVDAKVSYQIKDAITYDLFKPNSLVARVYPIVMQILRFRRRPPITSDLSDSAMMCLLKMMLASTRICNHHLIFVYHYMKTTSTKMRSNMLLGLADIIMSNPYTFSKRSDDFLTSIHDKSPNIRLVSLLVIHYLNCFKVIVLSDDNKAKLAMLLLDCNEHVVKLARFVFHFMITECNVPVSGLIRDVLKRFYEHGIREYDFKPVAEFFFSYIKTIQQAESTANAICQNLVKLAREYRVGNRYIVSYAALILDCLILMPKAFKVVQKLTSEMDKFQIFFKYKKVCNRLQNYVKHLKKGGMDNTTKDAMLAAIDGIEKKFKKIKHDMELAARFDSMPVSVAPSMVPSPAPYDVEMEQDEKNVPDVVENSGLPASPKRKHEKDEEAYIKTKKLRQEQLLGTEAILNGSAEVLSPSSSTKENDENRSRLSLSQDDSTPDNSTA